MLEILILIVRQDGTEEAPEFREVLEFPAFDEAELEPVEIRNRYSETVYRFGYETTAAGEREPVLQIEFTDNRFGSRQAAVLPLAEFCGFAALWDYRSGKVHGKNDRLTHSEILYEMHTDKQIDRLTYDTDERLQLLADLIRRAAEIVNDDRQAAVLLGTE